MGTAKRMQILHSSHSQSSTTSSSMQAKSSTIGNDEFRIAKKLGLVAGVILIFFLVQCVLTLYFLMDFNEITLEWRIVDLLSHFLCLSVICFMYHKTLITIRNKLYPNLQCCAKKMTNLQKRRITVGSTTEVEMTNASPASPSMNSTRDSAWNTKVIPPISPPPSADSVQKFTYDVEMQSKQ